jgi:hypothetical protein
MPDSLPKQNLYVRHTSTFAWPVYRLGYRWISTAQETQSDWGFYLLTSGVDIESEVRDSESYTPYELHPGLFREFAAMSPGRQRILQFANQYGRLGVPIAEPCSISRPDGPVVASTAEPLYRWAANIFLMREMIELWTAVQMRDEAHIRKRVHWTARGALFESGPNPGSVDLPRIPVHDTSHLWSTSINLDRPRAINIRGWIVHKKQHAPDVIDRLQSDLIGAALEFLKLVVNSKLASTSIGAPKLDRIGHELLWRHLPSSLLGVLWLQFAEAIAANRTFRQCHACNKWFEVAPQSARSDKLYCSNTCRIRAYRTRQSQAREAYRLGSSIEELSERFDADRKTIAAWLRKSTGPSRRRRTDSRSAAEEDFKRMNT